MLTPHIASQMCEARVGVGVEAALGERQDVVDTPLGGGDRFTADAAHATVALDQHRHVYVLDECRVRPRPPASAALTLPSPTIVPVALAGGISHTASAPGRDPGARLCARGEGADWKDGLAEAAGR